MITASLTSAFAPHYELERELGRGGMATVYLGRDLRHERFVAIKVLHPTIAAAVGAERFLREIRIAAHLQHPHILPVFDSGECAGRLWYAMPYVEGESLRDRLRREGALPLGTALRIARDVAEALDYAHRHGVVHRDIKPENILLADGQAVVADFGIARPIDGGNEAGVTLAGVVVGTPGYLSPEQGAGSTRLDGRSDLYSLGCVLFEMLVGERLFSGPTSEAVIEQRFLDPSPLLERLPPSAPAQVRAVLARLLAPHREERFESGAQLAAALADERMASQATTPVEVPGQGMPRSTGHRRVRAPPAAVMLGLGFVIGLGALFAWWRMDSGGSRPGAGTPIVAVLPFENLGDSADGYFAEGVADEIRTKLAQVAGLEMIARGSSIEYRRTTMRPAAIARELGADYLLSGTVRWEKSVRGHRVRVTPELVDTRSGRAGRTRWVQQFDASLTDVFQVQADIASKVADALGVALADSTRRVLTARPTGNLAAYDEFLKGEAASQEMKADQAGLRRAIGFYERAVALDSTFVQAWSQLSRARTSLYSNGVPSPELGEAARLAAERARRLRPNDPSVYLAFGDYYGSVNPIDNERALAECEQGLRLAPDNVDLLGTAVSTQTSLGRWEGVAARLAHAALLDPRSLNTARRLAAVHTFLRNYAAADSAADRAVALAPTSPAMVSLKLLPTLARGDLDSARAVIRAGAGRIDPGILFPFFASYQDLYWVLDDDQQMQVLASPPSAFDDDRGVWGMVQAELYRLRGDSGRAAAYADSSRLAFEEQSRAAPDDGQRRVLLGLALAYLGRKTDAVREGQRGVQLMPISRDGYLGPYIQLQLVRIYLLVGEPELALDQLEPLLRVPFYLSPGWLRIDPTFDPLRNSPRFRRLVEGIA
jgi:serine/threonine-protein kinase